MSILTILHNLADSDDTLLSAQQIRACADEPYFFSVASGLEASESIKATLQLPYSLFIEIQESDKIHKQKFSKKDLNQINILKNLSIAHPNVAISITTGSCYASDLAHSLTDMIGNRFNISDDKKVQIVTCLHEAIMNAILHGNLNIESDFRTLKGLYIYQTEIEHRLKINSYKLRRVHIKIWNKNNSIEIAISDEGNGFDIPTKTTDDTLPNGRGLRIISSLADKMWLQDRHTLFMKFSHQ